MKKLLKSKSLIISLVIAVVLTVAVFAVSALAADETSDTPVLTIETNNLSYADSIYMLYAVSNEGFDKDKNEIKMLFWNDVQDEYLLGTEDYVSTSRGAITYNGKRCEVFYSEGIPARKMTVEIYSRAYVEIDGVIHYSEVKKFSILEYAYLLREKGANPDLIAMADAMLEYGAAAQKVLNFNLDKLANATYYRINVAGGTLADGFTSGLFIENGTVTVKAEKTFLNYVFKGWENSKGEIVSTSHEDTFDVVANETYSAKYEELPSYSEGLRYVLSSNKDSYTLLDAGDCTDTTIIIPPTYNGLPVKRIGADAFKNSTTLEKVVIPDSITTIDSHAFYNCDALTTVIMGDGLTRLNGYVFTGCALLSNVQLGKNITSIGPQTFESCTSLTSIEFPAGLTQIDYSAFHGTGLVSVSLPEGFTTLGDNVFTACKSLETITLPTTLTTVGGGAFQLCTALKTVNISDLASYFNIMFESDTSNPASLSQGLYLNGSLITEVVVPAEITDINDYLFYSNKNITSIKLHNNVKSVGNRAFAGCNNVSSIDFGSGLETIGEYAFAGCNISNVSLPASLKDIQFGAFNYCIQLSNVVIPDSVTNIGGYAFNNCTGLTSINIPKLVTTINTYTFGGCSKLESVIIDGDITTIKKYAFNNCTSLSSITIPPSLTTVESRGFYGCTGLKAVYISDLASWCKISFTYDDSNPLQFARNLYLNGELLTELVIPEGVTEINDCAFFYCNSIKSVVIPDGVTRIGNYAFSSCSSLESASLADSITNIGYNAFNACVSLTSVAIPAGVTSIDNYTFAYCRALENVTFKGNITSIGACAFTYCEALDGVTIPATVTSIGQSAFSSCYSLTSIVIPDTVTSLGIAVFSGCKNLESVTLPSGITTIGSSMFRDCRKLCEITIPGTVNSIGSYAFYDSAISKVYFDGKASDWENVTIGSQNDPLLNAEIVFLGKDYTEGLEFTLSSDETYYSVTGYTGTDAEVIIPEEYEGLPVKDITTGAFLNCTDITNVVIPKSVVNIGLGAFSGCSSISSITIPFVGGGRDADYNTGHLFGYIFGKDSYEGGVQTNQYYGYNSHQYGSFYIPSSLKSVTVLGGNFSRGAFYSCDYITDVTILNSLGGLGMEAFYSCDSLTNVILNVSSIGDSAFSKCSNLRSISMTGVTSIGYSAFSGCSNLTSITLPDTLTRINSNAFGSPKLVEVINHSSLDIVPGSEDHGSVGYYAKVVHNGTTMISNYGDYLFLISDDDNCLLEYLGNATELILPESCNGENYVIHNLAFYNRKDITSVIIPNSVTKIGNSAFYGCTGLSAITIPDSVTSMGSGVFYNCSNLTNVIIGNSVTEIGPNTFQNCKNVTSLTIGNNVAIIGDYAFESCQNLKTVNIPNSVTTIGNYAFRYCSKISEFTIGNGVVSIGKNAFESCTSITSVALPDSLISIDEYAFKSCSGITNLTFGNSITTIGRQAFLTCSGITSVIIPDSVTSIGVYAFQNCSGMTSITIGKGITDLGNYPFSGCSKLVDISVSQDNPAYKSIDGNLYSADGKELIAYAPGKRGAFTVPNEVTKIAKYAFYNCEDLTSVTMGDNVTVIGSYAFNSCSSLSSIVISSSVTSIERYAINECYNVKSVVFNNPTGWWYASSSDATSGTAITEDSLANATTAATTLKNTYASYYWHREDVAE